MIKTVYCVIYSNTHCGMKVLMIIVIYTISNSVFYMVFELQYKIGIEMDNKQSFIII
jgi:hypothetical protein